MKRASEIYFKWQSEGTDGKNYAEPELYRSVGMEELKKNGIYHNGIDGYNEGKWVVLDYGDIIVHLFRKEERDYYNLERLWETGRNISHF